jgi:hypothetical protein
MRHVLACHAHLVFDATEVAATADHGLPRRMPPCPNPRPSLAIERDAVPPVPEPDAPSGALRLPEPGLLSPKLAVVLVALLPLVLGA